VGDSLCKPVDAINTPDIDEADVRRALRGLAGTWRVRNGDERAPARPTGWRRLDGHGRIMVADRALEVLLGWGRPAD
jgi:hypothetical protein